METSIISHVNGENGFEELQYIFTLVFSPLAGFQNPLKISIDG